MLVWKSSEHWKVFEWKKCAVKKECFPVSTANWKKMVE